MKQCSIICALLISLPFTFACATSNMLILCNAEYMYVDAADLQYRARVDTGAKATSIHATNVEVVNGSTNMLDNIGHTVRFSTANETGEKALIEAVIAAVDEVRSSHGIEYRYYIQSALSYSNVTRTILVNLRDRSHMDYKLLVGRNWLSGVALVDSSCGDMDTPIGIQTTSNDDKVTHSLANDPQ